MTDEEKAAQRELNAIWEEELLPMPTEQRFREQERYIAFRMFKAGAEYEQEKGAGE